MDKDLSGTRDVDDFLLVTTTADIEYAHNHGYNLRAIQGYVYAPCTPEPGCIPPGAEKLYRACNTAAVDCATFLESETAAFAAKGYVTTFPPIADTKTLLGYAYPATDTDGGVPLGDPCAGGVGARYCGADVVFANGFDFPWNTEIRLTHYQERGARTTHSGAMANGLAP
jgi:hypothetical protein